MRSEGDPPHRIGIIVPFDFAHDDEYWCYVPANVSLHITRTPFEAGPVSLNLVAAVSSRETVQTATKSIVAIQPEVVAYACTSGSFAGGVVGEARLRRWMLEAGARSAITTSGAAAAALRLLGAGSVAIAAPYDAAVTERLAVYLCESGFDVAKVETLGMGGGIEAVDAQGVIELAMRADSPSADAVFIACTNLRTVDVIGEIERRLRKPVVTANQATIWGALQAVGASTAVTGQRLFEDPAEARAGRPR